MKNLCLDNWVLKNLPFHQETFKKRGNYLRDNERLLSKESPGI